MVLVVVVTWALTLTLTLTYWTGRERHRARTAPEPQGAGADDVEEDADECRGIDVPDVEAPPILHPSFTGYALAAVPFVTAEAEARAVPELAVLSTVAHSNEPGGLDVLLAAVIAIAGLPDEKAKLYLDLVYAAIANATRVALEALMNLKG